jgi:hypothetical protein
MVVESDHEMSLRVVLGMQNYKPGLNCIMPPSMTKVVAVL